MKKQKDYVALLMVPEMPKTKVGQARFINWLRSIAKEVKKEDPKIYATPCRFRLMK